MSTTAGTTFDYAGRDRTGQLVTGSLVADSQTAMVSRLKSMGYAPISITAAQKTGMNRELKLPGIGTKKVKLKDLAVFSRQFATMIDLGCRYFGRLTSWPLKPRIRSWPG